MKISVIGTGNIGGTLGSKWAAAGHEVIFGTRNPQSEKVQGLLQKAGNGTTAVPVPQSIANTEAVLFAIPGGTMAETAQQSGSQLNGKIVIDATNNVGKTPMNNLDLLRKTAPNAYLFRAFSTLGWENFANPNINGTQADLFYCGDGGDAQTAVHNLIADIGLNPVCLGGNETAPILDSLTQLWFILALQQKRGRHLAFKMLNA